jgi:hypothetical protein
MEQSGQRRAIRLGAFVCVAGAAVRTSTQRVPGSVGQDRAGLLAGSAVVV